MEKFQQFQNLLENIEIKEEQQLEEMTGISFGIENAAELLQYAQNLVRSLNESDPHGIAKENAKHILKLSTALVSSMKEKIKIK